MIVFFTSENESLSQHSLDTLDSRNKTHYPANDRPGYNILQQSVLELLRQEEMQDEKEKDEIDVTSYLEEKIATRQAYIWTE